MQATLSLQSWLDHLRSLSPVTGVVHVGAGTGQVATRYADWGISSAVLIEAEESCHDKLAAVASRYPGWSVHTALLSDLEEKKDFYVATNPNENGVLPPERLASLWRNLKTKEQRRVSAITLDRLLNGLNPQAEPINWVVIDCLPALPVMRGAGPHLDGWDVIIARVVLDEAQLQTTGATKAEVDAFLSKHGYRCLSCEEERQPAVGTALYVRDWKTSLHAQLHDLQQDAAIQAEANAQLQQTKDEQSQLAAERQQQVTQLTKTGEEQTKLATERQAQLDQLSKAKDEQARLAAERQQQVAQLTKTSEEQTKLAAERQAQLDQLSNAKDEQARLAAERQQQVTQLTKTSEEQTKLAAERQAQLEQLSKAKDEQTRLVAERQQQVTQLTKTSEEQTKLAAERQALVEQLKKARDEQVRLVSINKEEMSRVNKLSQERAEQIAKLNTTLEEMELRQNYLNEEMIKAEAQIELIKDVLLREPML